MPPGDDRGAEGSRLRQSAKIAQVHGARVCTGHNLHVSSIGRDSSHRSTQLQPVGPTARCKLQLPRHRAPKGQCTLHKARPHPSIDPSLSLLAGTAAAATPSVQALESYRTRCILTCTNNRMAMRETLQTRMRQQLATAHEPCLRRRAAYPGALHPATALEVDAHGHVSTRLAHHSESTTAHQAADHAHEAPSLVIWGSWHHSRRFCDPTRPWTQPRPRPPPAPRTPASVA